MSRPTTEENQGSGTVRRLRHAGLASKTSEMSVKRLRSEVRLAGRVCRASSAADRRRDLRRLDLLGERGEEQRDLARSRLRTVGAVHEVLLRLEREVATDRARCGFARVRGAHEPAHDLPRVRTTLDDHRDERPARDERDEVAEERLLAVLLVVTTRELGVEGALLHRDDGEALALQTADDLTDETAFHRVRLAEDQGAGGVGHVAEPSGRARCEPDRRRTGNQP